MLHWYCCRNAVLDTNVSIGNDVSITNMYGVKESDRADTGGLHHPGAGRTRVH